MQPAALDENHIRRYAGDSRRSIRVEQVVDSTNLELARLRAAGESVDVLLGDTQTAGRGRRERHWISPPGCGLYLSWYERFDRPATQLGALSLVVGLAAAAAVAATVSIDPGLKWPNDLIIDGHKLGGCLVDLSAGSTRSSAIIGIGINVDFGLQAGPDQPWTDLVRTSGQAVDRNELAGQLIRQLHVHLQEFQHAGLTPFVSRWNAADVLCGRMVRATGLAKGPVEGHAEGIDDKGRLLLRDGPDLLRLSSGEVSLRTLSSSG